MKPRTISAASSEGSACVMRASCLFLPMLKSARRSALALTSSTDSLPDRSAARLPIMKVRVRSDRPSAPYIAAATPMWPTRSLWPVTPSAVSPWAASASTSASASALPPPSTSAPSCSNSPDPPSVSCRKTCPAYSQRCGSGPLSKPSTNACTTEEVNSGRRLTLRPLGSVNEYMLAASSPPDFFRKRSVDSSIGVATAR